MIFLPTRCVQVALLLVVGVLSACTDSDDVFDGPPPVPPGLQTNNTIDRAEEQGLTTFADLAERSSFQVDLETSSPITVFGPNNAAFAALGTTRLEELRDPANLDQLDAIIGRLLVAGDYDSELILNFNNLVTATGDSLRIDAAGGVTTVDEASIVAEDAEGDNGRLYVLDAVPETILSPIASLERSGLDTMVQLIDAAGLTADVESRGLTILAPTEAAFAALPVGELDALLQPMALPELLARVRLHLVDGLAPISQLINNSAAVSEESALLLFSGGVGLSPSVNGATISSVNRPTTTGGLIHEIDAFLSVPPSLSDALDAGDLTTLDTLVTAASLEATLSATTPLTLFAPSDTAFAGLPPGVVNDLLMPANLATLQTLLQSHAVAQSRPSGRLEGGTLLQTLAGTTVAFTDDGALLIDGIARIESADRFVRNGVIHVIDAVLAAGGL